MTTPNEALLPCPFCGGDDVAVSTLKGHFCVQCACEANGPWKQTPASAEIAWNTRATIALPAPEVYVPDTMDFACALPVEPALQPLTEEQRQINELSVAEFAAQSANRHLSTLVDFERQVSARCMAVMQALMDSAEPVNNDFQDCHIDYAEYAKFVDAHAELLYVIKNGERPAAHIKAKD